MSLMVKSVAGALFVEKKSGERVSLVWCGVREWCRSVCAVVLVLVVAVVVVTLNPAFTRSSL